MFRSFRLEMSGERIFATLFAPLPTPITKRDTPVPNSILNLDN